ISFYQRKEIKDFLAYLRVIVNQNDEEALKRIINYPARGIGKTSLEKAVTVANEANVPLFDVFEKAAYYGIKGASAEAIGQFVQMIRYFQSMLVKSNAYDVAVQVGKHTGMVKELFNDKSAEGLARYENVQELLNSIKEWVDTQRDLGMINEDGEVLIDISASMEDIAAGNVSGLETAGNGVVTLGAYLQNISLLTDADEKDEDADVVKLMTVHSAKGLEFPCVFVGGMEETLFPSGMSINTREELEEERRLFYVAVTRAKKKLWLTHAQSRYRFGQLTNNEPSRFLEEIPATYLDRTLSGGGLRNQANMFGGGSAFERLHGNRGGFGGGGFGNGNSAAAAEKRYGPPPAKKATTPAKPTYVGPSPAPRVVEHQPSTDFVPSNTSNLKAGDRVEHQKFGFGTVTKMEGASHNPIATVQFELNGEKKIMLNYAKLRIVES
nr:ATP-binding domain-containing protein [Chitinophagaceae bacterium]